MEGEVMEVHRREREIRKGEWEKRDWWGRRCKGTSGGVGKGGEFRMGEDVRG